MKRTYALLLACVMVLCLFTGCGAENENVGENTSDAKRDDVIIYCEGTWTDMDPHGTGADTMVDAYVMNQVYEPLARCDDSGDMIPVLAKDWEISEDGLTYTFTLQDGVKFHNGDPMTVQDVKFSFDRVINESTSLKTYNFAMDSCEIVDDSHFAVHLKYPFAPFPTYLVWFPVVSEKFTQEHDLRTEMCGTGPYSLESIDFNTEAHLEAFPDYWQGEASIKNVTFKVITEATTATVSFEAGELDVLNVMNVSAFAPLEASGKYNTMLSAQKHTALILLNNTVAPLDNKLVRQALSYATDRETMIAIAYEGLAQPTYLMANTSCFGVTEKNFQNPYPYDLEKAKELLAEAGYPDGLDLGVMTVLGGTYHEKYAQVWQQSLAQIGVKIELVNSESCVADTTEHRYVTATMGEPFSADFSYTNRYYTGDNKCAYQNDRVDELFELAAAESDSAKRLEYYDEVISIVKDEAPCIPIFNKQAPWAWDKNLNATFHCDGVHPYYVYEMSWN